MAGSKHYKTKNSASLLIMSKYVTIKECTWNMLGAESYNYTPTASLTTAPYPSVDHTKKRSLCTNFECYFTKPTHRMLPCHVSDRLRTHTHYPHELWRKWDALDGNYNHNIHQGEKTSLIEQNKTTMSCLQVMSKTLHKWITYQF